MIVRPFLHTIELAAPTAGYIRTPGLHMSDIYGSLAKKVDPKRFDKRDKHGNPTPMNFASMEMGTTFEELLEPALAARLLGDRPGEFRTRVPPGILYTPDYLFYEDDTILGEFKCTWWSTHSKGEEFPLCAAQVNGTRLKPTWDGHSVPMFPRKADKWFWQTKAYLHHLGMLRLRLFVFFVNGDYKPPSPVPPIAWDFTFTTTELERNWAMLERHGRKEGLIA